MNIDFSARPGFSAYVILLMVSGITMLIMATPTVKHQSTASRLLNGAFGIGFFGYGFYLAFIFTGGSYLIFFKALILPVVLIARSLKGAATGGTNRYVPPPPTYGTSSAYPPPPPAYGATSGYPPPTYPAPPTYGTPAPMHGAASRAVPMSAHEEGAGWLSAPIGNAQPVLRKDA